jgi:hypothetical protein
MAQLTGTAGRSASHTPAAFVAGTLLASAVMATGIVLALALGVNVELRDEAAAPRAGVTIYDGRLDPIEADYIRRGHQAPGYAPEPSAPANPSPLRGGIPHHQRVPS